MHLALNKYKMRSLKYNFFHLQQVNNLVIFVKVNIEDLELYST